jgi:hypothetical protein
MHRSVTYKLRGDALTALHLNFKYPTCLRAIARSMDARD